MKIVGNNHVFTPTEFKIHNILKDSPDSWLKYQDIKVNYPSLINWDKLFFICKTLCRHGYLKIKVINYEPVFKYGKVYAPIAETKKKRTPDKQHQPHIRYSKDCLAASRQKKIKKFFLANPDKAFTISYIQKKVLFNKVSYTTAASYLKGMGFFLDRLPSGQFRLKEEAKQLSQVTSNK